MNLQTPLRIRELQRKLKAKAKSEPEYRFYALYDKVYRPDILEHAYRLSKANGGAPGVDGRRFEDIEEYGVSRFLAEVAQELKEGTYRPEAVRRVYIPKPGGGERPLGIPTIKDRVIQTAVKLVMEPIFEADFPANAYAYREGRNAQQAVLAVQGLLRAGYLDVVDADVSKYFDTIPHAELMKSVARRVVDRRMLRLIKSWLEAPVEEVGEQGRKKRTGGKDHHLGTPQGGVVSPLLANIYMRRFLIAWERWGLRKKLKAYIVNYADDFVVLCRGTADQALVQVQRLMDRLKLKLNGEKTQVRWVPGESFDFLGYTFGRLYDPRTGEPYVGVRPSRKSLKRLKEKIHRKTAPSVNVPIWEAAKALNQLIRGWAEYFSVGTLSRIYGAVDRYSRERLRAWLVRRCKVPGRGTRQFPDQYFDHTVKLVRLVTELAKRRRSCAVT